MRSSTSRGLPSRTSSDLDTPFVFFPSARAAAASDTAHLDNLGAFICPRIGLTALFVDLICVLFGQAGALRGRDSGVRRTSAETGPDDEAYRGPVPSPRFPNLCRFAPA